MATKTTKTKARKVPPAKKRKPVAKPKATRRATSRATSRAIVEPTTRFVDSEIGLKVRVGPSLQSAIVGVLPHGTPVVVFGEENGWGALRVTVDGVEIGRAYSSLEFLSPTKPSPITPPTPPTPPTPIAPTKILVGVNVLNDFGALREAEANGCKFAMIMDGVSEAVNFARAHPDGYAMLRRFIGSSRWTARDFIQSLGIAADMPRNLVVTLFNEADSWGSEPSALEERMRVESDFVREARAMGFAGVIAVGTYSVGNPQFAQSAPEFADTTALIKRFYAPLWNANQIALDYHSYSPTLDHISNDDDLFWFERRWEAFFRFGDLDPTKGQGVFFGETGLDEMGRGGFRHHAVSASKVEAWIRRFVEIQSWPLEVNGVAFPSPVRGGAIFCYGHNGDPRWRDGYDIRNLGAHPFRAANVW